MAQVVSEPATRPALRRELRFPETASVSVGVMAPTLAMSVTGVAAAAALGRAAPLAARGEPSADDWFPGPGDEAARSWSSIDAASRWDTAPESAVLSREALLELDRAVSALPPRQRQVVTMRDIGGMSAEEVCAALGITPANQRVLLHRARAALRTALAGYYRG